MERRHSGEILADLHCVLHDRFGVHHLTIQIEPRGFEEHGCVALGPAEEHPWAGA